MAMLSTTHARRILCVRFPLIGGLGFTATRNVHFADTKVHESKIFVFGRSFVHGLYIVQLVLRFSLACVSVCYGQAGLCAAWSATTKLFESGL